MKPQDRFRDATELLQELGITEPREIDVAAIAYHCGAMVIERPLTGCEARIIGVNDKAIITVNSNSIVQRRRFSAAHELGHWMWDAGRVAFGCNPDAALGRDEFNPETRANRYASDLLMPRFMFEPQAAKKRITFETVDALAGAFATSLTATALRLIKLGSYPAVLVCSSSRGLEWRAKGADVPRSLWPNAPGPKTYAADLLKSGAERGGKGDVSSDTWFSTSRRHYVFEDSRRIGDDRVLTLLSWPDEDPLIRIQEDEERYDGRRFDGQDD
jgi:hypothetical protein